MQGRESHTGIFTWPLGFQGMPALKMAVVPRDNYSLGAPPIAFSNQPSCSPQTVAVPCIMRSFEGTATKEDCGGGDPTWPGNISQVDQNTFDSFSLLPAQSRSGIDGRMQRSSRLALLPFGPRRDSSEWINFLGEHPHLSFVRG